MKFLFGLERYVFKVFNESIRLLCYVVVLEVYWIVMKSNGCEMIYEFFLLCVEEKLVLYMFLFDEKLIVIY